MYLCVYISVLRYCTVCECEDMVLLSTAKDLYVTSWLCMICMQSISINNWVISALTLPKIFILNPKSFFNTFVSSISTLEFIGPTQCTLSKISSAETQHQFPFFLFFYFKFQ